LSADFASVADPTPWSALKPNIDLTAVNPPKAKDAKASMMLDLDEADRADSAEFNRILTDWAKSQTH